jgi:hypothetical protein
MFYKRSVNLCLLVLLCGTAFSQQADNSTATPAYTHYFSVNGGLHSRGWRTGLQYGRQQQPGLQNIFQLDVLNLKSQKEFRTQNEAAKNSRRYVFGKLNTVTLVRAGYGRKRIITEKHYRHEIGIHWSYSGGISGGIMKPVYLDINYPDPDKPKNNTRPERYDSGLHNDQSRIYGNSRFRHGLNEIRINPGIYARTSLSFEWGSYQDELKELEIGFAADAFGKALPIMAFEKNQQLFLTAFFCVHFGNKW